MSESNFKLTERGWKVIGIFGAVAFVGLIVLAVMVLWDSYDRGAGWTSSGPENGFFPARHSSIRTLARSALSRSA